MVEAHVAGGMHSSGVTCMVGVVCGGAMLGGGMHGVRWAIMAGGCALQGHVAEGCVWQGGMCARRGWHACWGLCVVGMCMVGRGGMCGRGHACRREGH